MSQTHAEKPARLRKPRLALVAAVADNGVIGLGNALPWHLSADLKRFKTLTMAKPILMGRRTYESIGRPLPGRTSIVLTRNTDWRTKGVSVVHSLDDALAIAHAGAADEIMVIGGATLYERCLPTAERIYLTQIHRHFEGDTFFPSLGRGVWRELAREDVPATVGDEDGVDFSYSFVTLVRNELNHRSDRELL